MDDLRTTHGKNGVPELKAIKAGSKAGRALAMLGASKGGKALAAMMTPEQRQDRARGAVAARWAKYRAEKGGEPKAKLEPAHCGFVDHDGDFHPIHTGNTRLSYNRGGPNARLYECPGCGKFYTIDEARKLRGGKMAAP